MMDDIYYSSFCGETSSASIFCNVPACDGKNFKRHSGLKLHWVEFHQKIVEGFVCNECPYETTRRSDMVNHSKLCHHSFIDQPKYLLNKKYIDIADTTNPFPDLPNYIVTLEPPPLPTPPPPPPPPLSPISPSIHQLNAKQPHLFTSVTCHSIRSFLPMCRTRTCPLTCWVIQL